MKCRKQALIEIISSLEMGNLLLCKAMLRFCHASLLPLKFGNLMKQRSNKCICLSGLFSIKVFITGCVKRIKEVFQLQKTLSSKIKHNGPGKNDRVSTEFNGNLALSGPTALISIQHFLLNPLFASSNAVGLEWPPGSGYLRKNQANVFNKEKITLLLDIREVS